MSGIEWRRMQGSGAEWSGTKYDFYTIVLIFYDEAE
jgi:hypothetical protein